MSMTFNLLAINNVFKRMDNTTQDSLFVYTGIFLGIATLFFLPSFLFLMVTLFSLLIYTGSILRRLFLLMYGLGVVLGFASLYYYWNDAQGYFHSFFYASLYEISSYQFVPKSNLWWAAMVPLSILFFSIFKMFQNGRYINFQIKIQYVMFFYLIAGFVSILVVKDVSTFQLIALVPFITFFVSHYLLTIRNWIVTEASAVVIFALIFINQGIAEKGILFFNAYLNYEELIVPPGSPKLLAGKKLLVLGENIGRYQGAHLATPFLNWQLSSEIIQNTNYYDNLGLIYDEFKKDPPDIILDESHALPAIADRIPWIKNQYVISTDNPQLYFRKN